MSVTTKVYYKRELERAADLISGRLVLWMSLYGSGKCVMYRTSVKQIVKTADRGLAPVVYGAVLGLDLSSLGEDEFNDRIDDRHGIVWLGDISEGGDVLCGALLATLVESVRKRNEEN